MYNEPNIFFCRQRDCNTDAEQENGSLSKVYIQFVKTHVHIHDYMNFPILQLTWCYAIVCVLIPKSELTDAKVTYVVGVKCSVKDE